MLDIDDTIGEWIARKDGEIHQICASEEIQAPYGDGIRIDKACPFLWRRGFEFTEGSEGFGRSGNVFGAVEVICL